MMPLTHTISPSELEALLRQHLGLKEGEGIRTVQSIFRTAKFRDMIVLNGFPELVIETDAPGRPRAVAND